MQDDPRATVTEKATEHPLIGIMRVIRLKSIMGGSPVATGGSGWVDVEELADAGRDEALFAGGVDGVGQ